MENQLKVQVACSQGVPVASILTLRFKSTLMYKYGCADEQFFRLGGMQMLLWRAIEEAKKSGLQEFDLGRSDARDQGLIVFKNRLGAACTTASYFRNQVGRRHKFLASPHTDRKGFMPYIPNGLLNNVGKLLYRHFG